MWHEEPAPFEHWVSHDLVPPGLWQAAYETFPDPEWEGWRRRYQTDREVKLGCDDPVLFPASVRALSMIVTSTKVADDVSEMLGVHVRPSLHGGGMHCLPPAGGRLGMHVDFNRHPNGTFRRANLLVYLNPSWRWEWGGHLKLGVEYDTAVSYLPEGGLAVLFPTSAASWHGNPIPISPEAIPRKSFACYFYSVDPPDGYSGPHDTIFR